MFRSLSGSGGMSNVYLATDLTLGMPDDAAVKVSLLRLTNRGDRPRRVERHGHHAYAVERRIRTFRRRC